MLATAPAASAAAYSGNEMLQYCATALEQNPKLTLSSAWQEGVCAGKLSALVEVGPMLSERFRFCPPRGSTLRQAARIVIKFMQDNPARLNTRFEILANVALQIAWPCDKK